MVPMFDRAIYQMKGLVTHDIIEILEQWKYS